MSDTTRGTRCTVQRHGGDFCDALSAEDMPFPICSRHAIRLYQHMTQTIAARTQDPAFLLHGAANDIKEQREVKASSATGKPTIYYIQVGDSIKIGYTTQLRLRLLHYPPNKRVLAIEPGDMRLERKRHEQFAGLLAYGHEWFRPGPELIAHINEIRAKEGAPPIEAAVSA